MQQNGGKEVLCSTWPKGGFAQQTGENAVWCGRMAKTSFWAAEWLIVVQPNCLHGLLCSKLVKMGFCAAQMSFVQRNHEAEVLCSKMVKSSFRFRTAVPNTSCSTPVSCSASSHTCALHRALLLCSALPCTLTPLCCAVHCTCTLLYTLGTRTAQHSSRLQPTVRAALEGKGPQRRSQKRLDRRSEEVAKAVGGGYCWLQMPLKLALGVGKTVAGHRLGALGGEGGSDLPPFQSILAHTSSHASLKPAALCPRGPPHSKRHIWTDLPTAVRATPDPNGSEPACGYRPDTRVPRQYYPKGGPTLRVAYHSRLPPLRARSARVNPCPPGSKGGTPRNRAPQPHHWLRREVLSRDLSGAVDTLRPLVTKGLLRKDAEELAAVRAELQKRDEECKSLSSSSSRRTSLPRAPTSPSPGLHSAEGLELGMSEALHGRERR